jgi:S-DNA-T family DNA segregation ATPase FtsK/SpoIIIE
MAASGTSPRGTYVRDGLSLMCAGVAGWGAAPLLGEPGWALPALAAGTITGTGVATVGHRRQRRVQILDRASAAVAPLLGVSASKTQGLVQGSRWTNGWPGRPRRLQLHYGTGRIKLVDAAVEIGDQRWAAEVARTLGSRLEGTYQVADNDPSRGRLILKLRAATDAAETPETPQVIRAKRVVNELLGSTATFGKVDVDDAGEVRRLAVKHDVGSKLVAPGYRRRVERSVSVMLPGRWRAQWDMEGDAVTFEVRPTLPESIWIPTLALPDEDPLSNYRAVEVPYGVDEDGEVMAWRPAISPQWLLTGGTGFGQDLHHPRDSCPDHSVRLAGVDR